MQRRFRGPSKWSAWVVLMVGLISGCQQTRAEKTVDDLLYQSDTHGPPGQPQNAGPVPSAGHPEPQRIVGRII